MHLRVHHHNYSRRWVGIRSPFFGGVGNVGASIQPALGRRYCGMVPGPPDIRIRPATDEDRELLELLSSPREAGEYNTFETDAGYLARPVEVQRFVIEHADGAPIGDLSYFGVTYGPNSASTAWKIGITVLRSQRRKGFGWRAQRLLAEHLFATTGANRVEADTDVTNVAEQRALERAGFSREGVLRSAQYRGGVWHDLVLYSILRPDVEAGADAGPDRTR